MKNVKWLSLVLALVLCLFALPAQAEVQVETHTALPAIDLPDNDELFAGYVEKQLYAELYGGISTFGTGAYSAGSRLEGTAALIYEKLAAQVKNIAANGTGTADTIFTFGTQVNTVDGLLKPDYSCTITEADSSFVDLALQAVIADHPYEMYWFDKGTEGYAYSAYVTETGAPIFIEISFAVAPAYQNGAQYTVSAASAKVQAAVEEAQAVVAANASLSDMEKLEAYKAYICGAVSYNTNAVTNKEAYGDPWQLIYVFDGDSSTNVVCEGYSKAFQYLCDLSTFSNETLAVYTVSGDMAAPDESGVVGAGPHMWNIVSMGGKNYLVDVTNSEESTVGMGGELFMARAQQGGSVADGYVVLGYNNAPVTYKYDSDQESLWGEGVLTLAVSCPHDFVGGVCDLCGEVCEHPSFTGGVCTTCGIIGGYCGAEGDGTNLVWTLNDGTFAITGTGAMADYDSYDDSPWYTYRNSITALTIQEGVTTIGRNAFFLTAGLKSVTIPASVTKLGRCAFTGSGLETVTFADESQLTTIDDYAFQNCKALTEITLPAGVGSFRTDWVFYGCTALTDIHVAEGNTTYKGIDGVLYTADGTSLMLYPAGKTATSFTTPAGVTAIGQAAFSDNGNIESVTLSEGVTTIGDQAFLFCEALTTVTIPASVTSIGTDAFYDCTALTTVNAPCNWDGSLYTFGSGVTVNVAEHTPDEDSYTDNGDGTHDVTCATCGAVAVDNEPHTFTQNAEGEWVCACGAQAVASITSGSTVTKYMDFADAVAAWTDGTTLTLLDDVTYNSDIYRNAGESYTFVGNGHTLDLGEQKITNGGTLTIKGGRITTASSPFYAISNESGTLIISDGAEIINTKNAAVVNNDGTLTATDCTLTGSYTGFYQEAGSAELTNATIKGVTIYGGNLKLSACTVKPDNYHIQFFDGELVIDGDCAGWAIRNTNSAAAAIGTDKAIQLPADHYVFVGDTIVTELAGNRIGTIGKHTSADHNYEYTPNGDGTHTNACTAGCGVGTVTEDCTLDENNQCTLCKAQYVASITSGTTVTKYTDFAKAVEDWTDGTTLTLLDDVSYDASIEPGTGTRTFDGGDYTLDLGSSCLKNKGTLTINGGTITTDNMSGGTIENWGELIINGNSVISNNGNAAVINLNKFEATGGTLTASTGLDNEDDGVAVLNGTTLSNVLTWGNVTLTDCTITLDDSSTNHLDFRGGKVTINGDCAGWSVIYFGDNSAAVVGTDIVLPDNYYLFRDATVVSELEYHADAIIGKHTDHTYDYTINDDGLTHNKTCTAGCGAGETSVPHIAPDAEGKCVCGAQIVAEVGGTYYADFGKAVAAWTDGTTLTLLDDVSYDSGISVSAGEVRTFDGNGFSLQLDEEGVQNNGKLTIENGNLTTEKYTGYAVCNNSGANLTMTDTAIKAKAGCGVSNVGTIELDNCTISASCESGIGIDNSGIATLTGCAVNVDKKNSLGVRNENEMTLKGCSITVHKEAGRGIENIGTAELTDCIVIAEEKEYSDAIGTEGTMVISGGRFYGGNLAIITYGGKTEISNAVIEGGNLVGLWGSGGELTIDNCNISVAGDGILASGTKISIVGDTTISYPVEKVAVSFNKMDTSSVSPALDLTKATKIEGWEILNANFLSVTAAGTDAMVKLPADYHVFVDEVIVTELEKNAVGTIGKHTDEDHIFDYTINDDGLTHNKTCTAGCGAGETNVPHTAPDAEGKCVCGAQLVAKVGDHYYADFGAAVWYWQLGGEMTLLTDVSCSESITLEQGKTYTFNGGDYKLTFVEDGVIDNSGTLTVNSGTITAENFCAIQNSSTLNIEGGMVSAPAVDGIAVMNNSGTLTITGGTVSATAVSGIAVDNMDGTLTITGGTVSAMANNGFAIVNHSSMTLDGGTIEGYSCIENSGTAELKRGTVTASDGYALYNAGTATLSGADLATEGKNPAVVCNSGKTTISGGTLASNGTYVIQRVDGTLTITTTGCNGWKVISSAETATIGKDITLPEGYYVFDDDGKFIANLEAGAIGTITEHTHKTLPIDNEDGKSHDLGCACGAVSNQKIPHFVLDTEGKCVCGAQIVAKVDEAYYSDINVAINDWTTNAGTLTLLDDVSYASSIELEGGSYTFNGKEFILDMDGHWLSVYDGATLDYKGGTLDGILSISGTLNATGGTFKTPVQNSGRVTLAGAVIDTPDHYYAISNRGTLTISDSSTMQCLAFAGAAELWNEGIVIIQETVNPQGWRIKNDTAAAMPLTCLTLPTNYYVFMDNEAVTELAAYAIGTIRQHSHSYTATADDDTATITYACSCGIGTETAKLLAPAETLVYNGMAYISTVKLTGSTVAPAVVYTQNGQGVAEMKNAGDYTATINWHGKEVSMSITILPADIEAATATEGSRAYDATAKWVAPLELDGIIDGDDVSGWAEFQLPGINVGEYTEATLWEEPELTGADAGNYTLAPQDVTFVKATITKAAADKWSVNVAAQEVLVGSGLNAVVVPATGTGIGSEVVQITAMALYSDAELQKPATDADISGLGKDESITLYYKATADNYEAATGPMTVKAIAHQHEWTYAADEAADTITATCGGTIGTCPYGTITFKLVIPTGVDFNSSAAEKTATWTVEPVSANGLLSCGTTYSAVSDNAKLADGKPCNAGEYEVTLNVENAATVTATLTIAPAQIGKPNALADGVYTGEAHQPAVTIPDCTEGEDFTVTYPENMVDAGDKIITVTGMGNYTGTVKVDYTIARAPIDDAEITAEAQVYTGGALMPDFTVELNGKKLKHNEDYVFEVSDNVNVGKGKIKITGVDNYVGQAEGTFVITSAPANLTAQTYLGESQTGDFTYGDVITIKGAVTVDRQNTFSLRRAPAANEVALYLEGGNEVIAGPVAADPATGEFTMTYDTTNKDIQIGQRNLALKYVSDGNKENTEGSLTVTLNPKELTIISAGADDREYEKDNTLVAVTGVDLDGIAAIGDDVAADLTGVQGTLASDNAGDYTTMALPKLELTGRDKDYYTIAADEDVATDVTITKAQLVSVELPTDVTLDTYLASADQVAAKLPATVVYTDSNGDTVALDAAWTCADFDATPKAVNTFTWAVDAASLTNYELPSAVAANGTITVTNTDALPVVITGTDDSITFAEQPYGVAGMFAVDANAGDAHYEVVSGDAVLNGATLTVNKVGEIVIRLTTEANGAYASAEATATLTVTKADPDVTAPEGLTATYGQTLFNVALPDHDEGTWAWVDEAASVGNAGVQTHKITFTPNDTTNWNTLTLDVQVTVSKYSVQVGMMVLNGETETRIFTYGETVTVKALPQRPAVLTLRRFAAPKANQMALFLGDEQISEAVDPDENGIYTMTIPTADKALKIGDNTVTIKYVGTDNVEDAQGVATVTLLKKKLSIVNMAAQSREYQPENQQVAVTAVELEGKIEGDDVAVGTLTARVSSANVGSYAAATLPQTVPLAGEDADYYEAEGNVEVPVPQKVSITQATPEPTGTGADAGQPAVTPVTEDGKTLADIPLTLPEDAYNVPGTIHWVDGDDTPVEEGKEYAWVFIPDDPNYAPVNGTVVIYPAGEAPVITAPTAPQIVTVVEGETGTMTVTATEAEKYQWYIDRNDGKGYVAMEGATAATYTTSKVNTDNDGFTYYCQVSNAYGESKSPVFTLKVKAKVDVPQTGDEAQLGLWLALMVLSLGGMAAMVMNCKRREN